MQLRDFLSIASIGNSIYLFANKQTSLKESMDREAVIELSEKFIAGQIRIFDELVELKSRIPTIVREEFRKEIERDTVAELYDLKIMLADGNLVDSRSQKNSLIDKAERMQKLVDRAASYGSGSLYSYIPLVSGLILVNSAVNLPDVYQEKVIDAQVAVLDKWLQDESLRSFITEVEQKRKVIEILKKNGLHHVGDYSVSENMYKRTDSLFIRTLYNADTNDPTS